ncbi:MAG: wax ester/triacylglycerol synthase family O-acyltransferase [Acidobacteria bacterium]|nr:wax ester/triacylglycerol synthase family O-acyltransferase [Acidobacteriota bacterium]
MSSLDAAFLYLERKECPMHIASTSLFDGDLGYEELVKHIGDRIHAIPRYLQMVVPDPFNLGHPTWEYDENFDIRNHIFEVNAGSSVSRDELIEIAGRILSVVMDRKKPLWELYLVHNVQGAGSAMIAKVHHCMVDGISGVDLIKVIFDIAPEGSSPPPIPEARPVVPKPDPTRVFLDSLLGAMQEGMNRFTEMQAGLLHLTQSMLNPQGLEKLPSLSAALPAAVTPPPILPFNGKCSGERRLAWSEFSFSAARAIRGVLGGTVNDVVLTVLSESVARYVKDHGQSPAGRVVRFMVPVSLRQKDQRGALGNLISFVPIEIPLDIDDLKARFDEVNRKTGLMKEAHLAEGFGVVGAMYSLLPAPIQSILGAVADLPFPPFNMVATNVPGPQIPLYLAGRKLIAQYPYVPIGYGLGLGCAIFSYNQVLYFGLSSDAQAMPDVEKFKEILDEVFEDLKNYAAAMEMKAATAT